jgi:hypothetical protein
MKRRSFLKLLGIGAGAAMVNPTSLLGTAEAGLRTPGGLAKSWVVYPNRNLGCGFSQVAVTAEEFVIRPKFVKGVDPHDVFYRAALELRRRIGKATLDRLNAVPEIHRQRVEVVTSIFMPIHTRTKGCFEDTSRWTDEEFQGFDVVADCSIDIKGSGVGFREERGAHYGLGWKPPKGVEVYSETGEYPMELPSELDLGHMMTLERDFWNHKAKTRERINKVVLLSV